MTLRALIIEAWRTLKDDAHSPVALAVCGLACVLAGAFLSGLGEGLAYALVFCAMAPAIVLREDKGSGAFASRGMKVAVSALLVGLILLFLAVMTLLASGLAAFAIMTGSGFDFEAASQGQAAYDAAMAEYQDTPGWQLAMAVFLAALLLFLGAVARSLPFTAVSAGENRVVALEAFNLTRKHAARLLVALALFCAVPLLAVILLSVGSAGPLAGAASGLAAFAAMYAWHCVSLASFRLLSRPAEN